jgi:hypothetical protein
VNGVFFRAKEQHAACPFSVHQTPLEDTMKKVIALAIAGFVWKKLQSRFLSRSAARSRRGY